jgi:hypothetical protein
MSLRLFAKFVGETLGQDEVDAVLMEGAAEMAKREREAKRMQEVEGEEEGGEDESDEEPGE